VVLQLLLHLRLENLGRDVNMSIITDLIFIIILAITSSCFTKFITYCFNEGNILDWYYEWLIKYSGNNQKLFKLLGGCYICFNIWISTLIFELFNTVIGINYILFIPYIATSFIMSYYISKKDINNQLVVKYKPRTYISFIKTIKRKK
jgi:fructose-specific phosphotransferase system IIC component